MSGKADGGEVDVDGEEVGLEEKRKERSAMVSAKKREEERTLTFEK